jgi:hypothetical protein
MKKLILTIFMAFCLCMISFADNGGLFQRGETLNEKEVPMLQSVQRNTNDDAKDEVPLSGCVLLLTALGTAYAVSKKHKQ